MIQEQQTPRYRTTFVRLLGFLRPYKLSLIVSVLLAIGSQAAALALAWLTGQRRRRDPRRRARPTAVS